jgi:hypothetical protein
MKIPASGFPTVEEEDTTAIPPGRASVGDIIHQRRHGEIDQSYTPKAEPQKTGIQQTFAELDRYMQGFAGASQLQSLERTSLDDTLQELDDYLSQRGIEAPRQTSLREALLASDNPVAAIHQYNAAQYLARETGMDPEFVYSNLDAISEQYWGRRETPERIVDIFKTQYRAGQITTELGNLNYEVLNNLRHRKSRG